MEDTELNEILKDSENGNSEAQYKLGKYYYNSKDYDNAIRYFKMAIENENASAEIALADCYFFGKGIEQDKEKAHEIYEKYAILGIAEAQYNLAYDYFFAICVDKDYKKAVEWYEKSANQGYVKAQNNLGFCYGKGYGVEKNLEKEVEWYIKSANQGNKMAQCNLAKCYYYGSGVKKDVEKARILWEKSAKQGHSIANSDLGVYYYNLGIQYIEELNIEKKFNENYEKAMEYFLKNKNPSNYYTNKILKCMDCLIEIYKTEHKSIENLYEKLSEFNSCKILLKLGEDYEKGYNVKQDLNKSLKCYLKIARMENSKVAYFKIVDFCKKYENNIKNSAELIEEYSRKIETFGDEVSTFEKLEDLLGTVNE